MRELLAAYERQRDLILLGAYQRGSDRRTDEAIARIDAIDCIPAPANGRGGALRRDAPRAPRPAPAEVTDLLRGQPDPTSEADCLFCKIRDGQIPATIVYRDERVLAFKDIGPKAPLHELVIPLDHVERAGRRRCVARAGLLGQLMLVARAHRARGGLADKGFRVVMNSGVGAGQTVFHVHLHVLAGRSFGWPPG